MPLPAAWFKLCHVDSSRECRSGIAARPDAQADGSLWRRLSGRRTLVDDARRDIRCSKLPGIPGAVVATTEERTPDGRRRRQCALASRSRTSALVARTSPRAAAGFSAPVQSRPECRRTGLEVDPPTVYAQYILRDAPGADQCGAGTVRKVVSTESPIAPIMRNYLSRRV